MRNEVEFGTVRIVDIIRLLKSCAIRKDLSVAFNLHTYVREYGFLEKNVYIGCILINMYAKCGALAKAQRVLEELPIRNVITWSALIDGYVQQGKGYEALKCYDSMHLEGHSPNAVTFICALKACGSIGEVVKGEEIHDKIASLGILEKDIIVGNTLVDMYAKCGALAKAKRVLKELPTRDAVTWSSLIAGYAYQGQGQEALECYENMLHEGHPLDHVTFICALKACGSVGAAAKGEEIHEKIISLGLLKKDLVLGNTLVDMYVKCGLVDKAQQVLRELSLRNVVTWSALIAGYAHHGEAEQALKCYDSMLYEGHSPNALTFTCALRACATLGAVAKGKDIHDMIVSLGMLIEDIVLGNGLVDMYARCGFLDKAQEVLEELSFRDVVTWSILIAVYFQQGRGDEALKLFDRMEHEGHLPDAVTFTCVLKACGGIAAAAKGIKFHDEIIRLGMLENDVVLQNALVDMYTNCGLLAKAQELLDEFHVQDVAMWNALIGGYAQHGQGEDALKCFACMLIEGYSPDEVTFTCALKACRSIGATRKGEEIHSEIINWGMLEKDTVLGSSLVDMYARCGALAKAQQVLEELPVRHAITWTSLIAGHVKQGQGEEALKCFHSMLQEGYSIDSVTFAYGLKACGMMGATSKGEEIHDKILNLGMLEKHSVLGSSLVDMYAKCGVLTKAQQVLEELCVRDVVTWSALIAGYAQLGQGREALKCYDCMLCEAHLPGVITFICALKACGSIRAAAKGEEIHDKIVSLGMLQKDIVLGSSLVDMYVKCGNLAKAERVLEKLPVKDVPMWNVLIAGYSHCGQGEKALKCFNNMVCEGHCPDVITFMCALKACGSIGAAAKGEEIHDKVVSLGLLKNDIVLGSALVDMYVKCGSLAKAQQMLKEVPVHNVVMWSVLIGPCAQWGQNLEAENCFEKMQSKGVMLDSTTLISVLNACCHLGQLDQAETYFSGMSTIYGIKPDVKHYCCMVDLCGRAGKFNRALSWISEMSSSEDQPIWVALLGACHNWGEVKIGRLAFEHALYLNKCNASIYILMANTYTAAGLHEDAEKIDAMRLTSSK